MVLRASKILLAAEAAARGWPRSLTFNLCGGCAVAICAKSKKGYHFLLVRAAASVVHPATDKRLCGVTSLLTFSLLELL